MVDCGQRRDEIQRMKSKRSLGFQVKVVSLILLLYGIILVPIEGIAEEKEDGTSIQQVIDLLEQKGIVSSQEANDLKRRPLKGSDMMPGNQEKSDVQQLVEKLDRQLDHVQTKIRLNERQIESLEKQRVDKLADENRKSSWAQRISFNGDIRLRFEGIYFDDENYPLISDINDPTGDVINSTIDQQRIRARLRLGLKAKIIDPRDVNVGKVEAAVRLSTGSATNPVSTNETLGDYFNKDTILFDRYYLRWTYKPLQTIWGRIPQVRLTGGRMPNPWFSSPLVWDNDLNFEGVTLNFKSDTLAGNGWHFFITGGAYPLEEVELSSEDKWLYGGQIGFEVNPFYGLNFRIAAAYYDYENIAGQRDYSPLDPGNISPGIPNYTAPGFMQKGNTTMWLDADQQNTRVGLASDFDIIDITAELDFNYFFPVHVVIGGTYAKNIGFDQEKVSERAARTVDEDNEAYRLSLQVGYPKIHNSGDWNVFYEYRYIEPDAVLDAFNDSDFHLGGTNCKGWITGMEVGLYRDLWLRVQWMTSDEIMDIGPPFAVDTLQVDINARF